MDPRGRPNSIPVAALADSAVVKTKYTFPYEDDNKVCTGAMGAAVAGFLSLEEGKMPVYLYSGIAPAGCLGPLS